MKTIYAIPNFECNLNCAHCDIHKKKCEYNEEKFILTLNSVNVHDVVILFGGEPTLHHNRFRRIINTGKINSISTNLVDITNDQIKLILENNISISTSWNVNRFTREQYEKWINNLSFFKNIAVLITLTLNEINNYDLVIKTLQEIKPFVNTIMFEYLVSEDVTSEFYSECDDFLCKLYNDFKTNEFDFNTNIFENLKNGCFKFDCENTYTIFPDGIIKNCCPHDTKRHFITNCVSCLYASICKPCPLVKYCSFPKKLFEHVK